MKRLRLLLITAAMTAALFITPASALEYTFDSPSTGDFSTPTSAEDIIRERENPNTDKSKNSAFVPPGPVGSVSSTPPAFSASGNTSSGNVNTSGGYTEVTSDSYYKGGHLGRLEIPAIDLSVKIFQGTDSATLKKGIGHFTNTSIWDGNVSLAAHNRGPTAIWGKFTPWRMGAGSR